MKHAQIRQLCDQHCVALAWAPIASGALSMLDGPMFTNAPPAETARRKRGAPPDLFAGLK